MTLNSHYGMHSVLKHMRLSDHENLNEIGLGYSISDEDVAQIL